MSEANRAHIPVLLDEVLKYLDPAPGQVFIDATAGEGGHALAIAKLVAPDGKVFAIDADPASLEVLRARVEDAGLEGLIETAHGNFREVENVARQMNIPAPNGVLFDLGLSSWQLEKSNRGFSFQKNEPLDMRFDPTDAARPSAADVVNSFSRDHLTWIFTQYGEEVRAQEAARAIVNARRDSRIETTGDLVNVLADVLPAKGKRNPATRIFQALRIAVNDEFTNIKEGLNGALAITAPGGYIAVITFHSLEDRLVKHTFKEWGAHEAGTILTKNVVKPTFQETQNNRRARSAKLRVFQKA